VDSVVSLDLPSHRSVLSPCPGDGFIIVVAQGQLSLPNGCVSISRHEATTPFLPFGPSAR
jgi:hypothetical protein